ncbi:MAG: hypothetical protein ACOC4M_02240 [Promethearchaeia archaeon]
MNKERILSEAQKIASKFQFWMVSGNINHLYGYVFEKKDQKYELEIMFNENFPNSPPQLKFGDAMGNLLGNVQLNSVLSWTPNSHVVEIVQELKAKIQEALNLPKPEEEGTLVPITQQQKFSEKKPEVPAQPAPTQEPAEESDEYITPDLNTYPPQSQDIANNYVTPEPQNQYSHHNQSQNQPQNQSTSSPSDEYVTPQPQPSQPSSNESTFLEKPQSSVAVNTELGLIQQYYAIDQVGSSLGKVNIYLTITLTKTFVIHVDFSDYPEKPQLDFPDNVKSILGRPDQTLKTLKKWNPKKNPHVVDVLQEVEQKLYFIKDIDLQSKKILGEYQCDMIGDSATQLRVHLLTYGFKEYLLDIDLLPYPKPPKISMSTDLQEIIETPVEELKAYKNWKEKESDAIEIIREISWLVDKNSRINFELELLKADYSDIQYVASENMIKANMQGKMKSQDITFNFEIKLPREYPMKVPDIEVTNKFEIKSHEKIKTDLKASFQDFFNQWTPFSYLVDLFNQISKKIFEVSALSCVICHQLECPTCHFKIAASEGDSCHIECPHCERAYHKHCWQETIKQFGKCGFCLKAPPPSML